MNCCAAVNALSFKWSSWNDSSGPRQQAETIKLIIRLIQPTILNPIRVGPQKYTVWIVLRRWMHWVSNGQVRMILQDLNNSCSIYEDRSDVSPYLSILFGDWQIRNKKRAYAIFEHFWGLVWVWTTLGPITRCQTTTPTILVKIGCIEVLNYYVSSL